MGRLHLTTTAQTRSRRYFGTFALMQKKGLFYMVGRDVNYRPIIVVNVGRIIELDLH